jgi:glucokinase
VDADKIAARTGAPVALLNDLEAMAYSLEVLTPDEQVVLQAGEPQPDGHAALVAAGTGLGEAALHRIDGASRWRPPSERATLISRRARSASGRWRGC